MIQVFTLEIFAQLTGAQLTDPVEFNILVFPAEFFEFSLNPQCKTEWPPGSLDRVQKVFNNSISFSECKNCSKFKEKANLFNKNSTFECNPLPNDSEFPENHTYLTEKKLSSFDTEDEDIQNNYDT